MPRLVALFAMMGVFATSGFAQSAKPRIIELSPGQE